MFPAFIYVTADSFTIILNQSFTKIKLRKTNKSVKTKIHSLRAIYFATVSFARYFSAKRIFILISKQVETSGFVEVVQCLCVLALTRKRISLLGILSKSYPPCFPSTCPSPSVKHILLFFRFTSFEISIYIFTFALRFSTKWTLLKH